MIGQHGVPKGPAVLGPEPVACLIAVPAKLRRPALCPDISTVGIKAEIKAANFKIHPILPGSKHGIRSVATMVSSGRAVDPVIQAPAEAVGPELLVAFAQPTEKLFGTVGFAVAVRVPQV